MAQSDFGTINPDTKSGSQLATDLNAWRTAVHSGHSGTSRPTYAVAGMIWINTSTNPYVVYFYDGADDITIGTVNTSTNLFTPNMPNTPAGSIAATTVQAAINELDSEKANLSGSTSQAFSMSTAALGTNTTQGATTEFANSINLPAFRAYAGTSTSITASFDKVHLNSESFDSHSAFDSTTNFRFQPQLHGWYNCHAHVQFASASYVVRAALYKNGAVAAYGMQTNSARISADVSSLIYLNGSTDYVELFASSATTQNTATGETITFFEAFRIFGV